MSALPNPRPTTVEPPSPSPAPSSAPHYEKPRSRAGWVILGILVLGGLLGWQFYLKPQQQASPAAAVSVKTVKVTVGNLSNTIRVAGTTSAREFSNITAPIMRGAEAGQVMILQKLVASGKRVTKGDVLAQLDTQTLVDFIDDMNDQVETAENNMKKLLANQAVDTQALDQTLRVGKSNLDKAILNQKTGETKTSIDQQLLKLAVDEAQASYKQNQADLQFKKVGQAADIKLQEINMVRQTRRLERAKQNVSKFTIKSPMDGLAVVQQTIRSNEMAPIQQGDQLSAGQLFVKVVRPDRMQVEATINQSESEKFRLGLNCKVRLDAYPGLEFPAKIYSLGAMAISGPRQNYFIRTVPVKIAIDGSDNRLIPDLSASVDVILAEEANVTQVPLAAVFDEQGKQFVYVKKGPSFERRAVETGIRSSTHVKIVSGVSAGDEVAVERPTTVASN